MRKWTKREVLKSGVVVSAGITSAMPTATAMLAQKAPATAPAGDNPASHRERLLLDFGWHSERCWVYSSVVGCSWFTLSTRAFRPFEEIP
jgi:hypothetical protein